MNYDKIYNMLTENKQHRKKNSGAYYERHHIVPRCMGGTNEKSNLVLLTCREHFLAHWLLVKMYPKNFKLICAWNSFCMGNNGLRVHSFHYDYARNRFIEALKKNEERKLKNSKTVKDQRWVKKGDTCSRINKEKVPAYLHDGWVLGRIKFNRPTPSNETRSKMSRQMKGRKITDDHKSKISSIVKNRQWINDGIVSKHAPRDVAAILISEGWQVGRIYSRIIKDNNNEVDT